MHLIASIEVTGAARLAIILTMDLINHAPVAQLDRVTGFEPVGREFESLRACHRISKGMLQLI